MISINQKVTLETYSKLPEKYIQGTISIVSNHQKEFIDLYLSKINKTDNILEVGTANGRGADYIDEKGYFVNKTDLVDYFIDFNKNNNNACSKFNVITDKLNLKYNLIIAHTVLLHFNEDEFRKAIQNIFYHLKENAYFACVMKKGTGEEYSKRKMDSSRYFKYYSLDELKAKTVDLFHVEYSNVIDNNYIHILFKKNKNTF